MSKANQAIAIPTKQFFVSMLTRDISLVDAILDLLDNCLDGALRISNGNAVDYSAHKVSINLSKDEFRIEDDCDGIPREIAEKYAFKMGRDPDDERDSDTETIGMYGIGMKRAIFKMGRNALVKTLHNGDSYKVPITSNWLDNKAWNPLPIDENTDQQTPGTIIIVDKLYPVVSRQFDNAAFINELNTSIGEHFTFFLQKGFKIRVNNKAVEPVHVEILVSSNDKGPAPYIFQKTINDVVVSIAVGLNTGRKLGSDHEDIPDFERERSAATAGWTVFCNDRAVIVGDKTRLTGWGDDIPMYHGQFSVITGIIEFRSSSAEKLPITTTKRALDTSSDIWLEARTKMREGLRVWINYTNAWKNHPRTNQSKHWDNAKPWPLSDVIRILSKRDATNKQGGGIEYNPKKKGVLPEPETQKPSSKRIVFSRPLEEIKCISNFLFDRVDEAPSIIGDECFEIVLKNAKANEGNK